MGLHVRHQAVSAVLEGPARQREADTRTHTERDRERERHREREIRGEPST
jgi:hypothetical protein